MELSWTKVVMLHSQLYSRTIKAAYDEGKLLEKHNFSINVYPYQDTRLLAVYCSNIAAILLQHILAILPQYCGNTGFRMQISFWQYCRNNPFWKYCGNTAKTIHKSSSGNTCIAAILTENISNLIC